MKFFFTQVIVLVLLLPFIGCSFWNKDDLPDNTVIPLQEPVTSAIDTSDWLTYENKEYRFSFRYPGGWGEVLSHESLKGIDQGERIIISFTGNNNVYFSLFSNNFVEGVGEGSPLYFNPNLDLSKSGEEIKESLNMDRKFGRLDVGFLEKRMIFDQEVIKIIGNRGYVSNWVGVSYLMPKFLSKNILVPNIMSVILLGEPQSEYTPEEMLEIVGQKENQDKIRIWESVTRTFQ